MLSQFRRLFVVCAAAALLLTGAPAIQGHASVAQWRITDLGTMNGADFVTAAGINDRGHVAVSLGYASTQPTHAFLWRDGRTTDLGTVGGANSYAVAVNNRDEVVGFSQLDAGGYHAFLWRDGRMTDLGTLGGDTSMPAGINDRGEVAGISSTLDGAMHAFLWRAGVMSDLGTLNGGFSRAYGVNNSGQVVGESTVDGMNGVPVIWQHGRIQVLDSRFGVATAVNDHGQAVGMLYGTYQGYLWQHGRTTPLDPSGQVAIAQANAINNSGIVVGGLPFGAFVWSGGRFTTLPTLGGSAGAADINDRNQIIGNSTTAAGESHLVMWTR